MNKEEEKSVRILLINDRHEDTEEIKAHLDQHMRLPWSLMHCVNLKEAVSRISMADIVILELELTGLSSPQQIFSDVGDMIFEIPIIALTGKEDNQHGLATYVMEKGAADTIIRGQFGRLVDAIEFALIRQKITTEARKSTDRTLADSKKHDAVMLQERTDSDAALLRAAKDKGAQDLRESKEGRADDQEKGRQILRMFTGDYSVDRKEKQ
jgi:hypothetical protein